ncbi:Gfo/Idh/MocA family protein [Gracilibacillus timonensis]|uniref:Gfo/Idh/MocA family protein n=1 Tax=Gracilibacillus timonensis TaxID=1816696 RepID=UPI000824DA7B|nr:Gfo/Idh/MocA family oxidoreductase [Gracilibacillus timonensis]
MKEESIIKSNVSIVLIGIGGYGDLYVSHLLDSSEASIVGVVDINPQKSKNYQTIIERQIPVFSSIETFYENWSADLAIISTPIHLHADQTCYALTHGSHVLCEKPMCTTVEDAERMIATRNASNKFLAIGFNWSFQPSIQALKHDIQNGLYGKPKRLKTIALWPRTGSYFERAPWAGRKYGNNGELIIDSVASNACAHYLHHMFYLLGATTEESAHLQQVTAELYRANPIENFDTCAVKTIIDEGVEVLYYATHAVPETFGPHFTFEFEHATISYTQEEGSNGVVAHFHDGNKKTYKDPRTEDPLHKLSICIEAAKSGKQVIYCGPEAAYAHTLCINSMHHSMPEIIHFPDTLIQHDQQKDLTWVEGLSETLMKCFEESRMPSEYQLDWAKEGKVITLSN